MEAGTPTLPTLLFGTVSGMIGVIASLPEEQFTFLLKAFKYALSFAETG